MIFGPRGKYWGSQSNVSRKTAGDWNDILLNLKFWWGKKSRCSKPKDPLFLLLNPLYVSHKCVSSKLRRWSCLKFRSLETPRKIVKCLSLSLVPVCSTFFSTHITFLCMYLFLKSWKKPKSTLGLLHWWQIFVKT